MSHQHISHDGMDHGGMDHGDMDHGGDQCSMNMLFTWSSKNLCIVFSQWHVKGPVSLILSLLAIVALTAGYEWVRSLSRKYEQSLAARLQAFSASRPTGSSPADESDSLLTAGKDARLALERQSVVIKAAFYALQIFYSFFIMLLFMTYNGWVMLAVAVGAFVGYILFSPSSSSTKTMACH
ncbi:hypothetical protein DV735_g3260, partial [Chaetothyriales sp. CBS 134920]